MTITTGNAPKALTGDRTVAKAAKSGSPKVRKMVGLARAFAGANHNDGGPACHNGGKMAHPCSGR